MTRECIDFAREHLNDDTARLLLSSAKHPGIDMPLAVQQIEGMRAASTKWPGLLQHTDYAYPPRLNREQASSEATARYKATLLPTHGRVADLTGGMGIDSLAFASQATEVDYVERESSLCALEERNFRTIKADNIRCHCADSIEWLRGRGHYDTIFIDPARRNAAGRKVAAFEDCQPDLPAELPLIRQHCTLLMVKASPMIDLQLASTQLQNVEQIHIVALRGECKEVLFLCAGQPTEPVIHCVDLHPSHSFHCSFTPSQAIAAQATFCTTVGKYIYEPHAALMKAGYYSLIGQRWQLPLLAPSTHLYTSSTLQASFPGRIFQVLQPLTFDRKAVSKAIPGGQAHVVVRNFPMEAAALQRKLGLREGGELFVIAATVGTRHAALLCRRIK